MTIGLITVTGLLLVFFVVVIFLKTKNNLAWASAVREALDYLCFIF